MNILSHTYGQTDGQVDSTKVCDIDKEIFLLKTYIVFNDFQKQGGPKLMSIKTDQT